MESYDLQIVTPDGEFYNGKSERLIVRTLEGDVCILARHIPYAAAVGCGEARVTIDGKVRRAACNGGMLMVSRKCTRLIATTFEWEENIDVERAIRAKERAEKLLKNTTDEQETEMAKVRMNRALVRINVAK